jgi:hypothetical protein
MLRIPALLILLCMALLSPVAASAADTYSPDEFLGLDLSTAVLSPKPLGPPTQFARVPVQASSDGASEVTWARNALNTEPRKVPVDRVSAEPVTVAHTGIKHARIEHPRSVAIKQRSVSAAKPQSTAKTQQKNAAGLHARNASHAHVAPRRDGPLNAQARDTRVQLRPCATAGICSSSEPAK